MTLKVSRGKKGTDKPIEIFIALFVILAVAMVLLKMFSSQIESKKREMEEQQLQEAARAAMEDLNTFCDSQCTHAHRSLKDKVTFCTSYYREHVDINKNNVVDYTMALDNIYGYCEDRIYCAVYRPCSNLNMENCIEILCDYLGVNANLRVFDIQYGLILPGDCYDAIRTSADQDDIFKKANHWYTSLLSSFGDPPTCP
ncbi:hypothetical protein KY348_00240 [Candidatus Woesearchaeota archaeon]|nr:hypothetical protein [Candidatus Woesearchaeota archaeon]